jgi:hypothetical protein
MKTLACIAPWIIALEYSSAYQLHEWGTFTTVSGSDGVLLTGLQREEEPLPPFVHSHFGLENGQMPSMAEYQRISKLHGTNGFTPKNTKGLGERPVSNVTVKMETPVIYFHSETGFKAHVKVGFEGGTISQWYPGRSGGETLPEPLPAVDPVNFPTPLAKWNIDFSKPYKGGIEWDVEVLTPAASHATLTFKPKDSVNWLRARVPEANVLRNANGETENYLFYRGIGNFKPGLRTTISTDEMLHLENLSGGDIPYLLVFEHTGGKVRWHAKSEGLKAGEKLSVPESTLTPANSAFPSPIYDSIRSGLTASGLLDSEADAMIQTWWNSYFDTAGLRVFWIVPQAVTDRILPLTVTPQPEKTVRTLVGRSEVLRPTMEGRFLAMSHLTGDNAWQWQSLVNSDRFGIAIGERVNAIKKEKSASTQK